MNTTMRLLELREFIDRKRASGKGTEAELRFFDTLIDIMDDLAKDVERIKKETVNDSFIDPKGGPYTV